MTSIGTSLILRVYHRTTLNTFVNGFHTSYTSYLQQDWRRKKGLTKNPNSFGPLTNLPDYSFKDGRPVAYGAGQRRRMIKQREYAERIVKLVAEVDNAVLNHAKREQDKKDAIQKILDNKLKPKGQLLLEQKEKS